MHVLLCWHLSCLARLRIAAMEGLRFSKTAHRSFHDVAYVLTISGDTETLSIEVEHAEDGRRWRSQFGARFIEEITQRTGNHKKFDVFVKMALSALSQESDAVYLDVLTARDLEMLRRHANPQGPPTTSAAGQSDKRYLILTYRAEFDKVHYPLPLQLDERSEEDTLRNMVGRLKSELAEARETVASLKQGSSASAPPSSSQLEEDHRLLQRRHSELAEELGQHRRESEALRSELRGLRAERDRGNHGGSHASAEPELRRLRDTCQRQQAELKSIKDDVRQKALNQKREAEQVTKELRAAKQNADRLQAQVKKLEEERKSLNARLQSGGRAPSAERSRAASRSPSADRSRPASRPPARTVSQPRSRPTSRASSVASSRERTPSPNMAGSRGTRNSSEGRPWAFQRSGSPASGPGARRSERQVHSPGGTISSPYSQAQAGVLHPRRNSSPGNRSRERTPSPGQQRRGATPPRRGASAGPTDSGVAAGSGASAASRRSAFSLREQRTAPISGADLPPVGGARGGMKPSSSRYGGRSASGSDQAEVRRSGSYGANVRHTGGSSTSVGEDFHRPGSLFGLAANLGLGPGSLAGAPAGADAGAAAAALEGGADACDIDARLQALQSFLKQTKTITG